MRIDIRDQRTQPIDLRWCQYGAYLDGVALRYCLMADEEAGIAVCAQVDAERVLVCDDQGEAILVTHRGRVELRRAEHP